MPSSPSSSTTTSSSLSRTSSVSSISSISESGECEVTSRNRSIAGVEKTRRRARNCVRRGMRMARLDATALDQLPPSMLVYPKKRHSYPKRYHFGFGVSLGQLHDYCVAQDLAPKHYHGKLLYHLLMMNKAVKELGRRCGAKLYVQDIRNQEYQFVLARYSNYDWRRNIMPDRDEQLAADVIQRELCICEPPKWFRD